MNKILLMTADDILKIYKPESLFETLKTEKEVKQVYIKLSFKWHPDHNKQEKASEVFNHIHNLYKQSKEKFKSSTWGKGFKQDFLTRENVLHSYSYIYKNNFELGEYFIGKDSIAWLFEEDYCDLAENCIQHIAKLKYANDKMKDEMKKFLPQILKSFITHDKKFVIIMSRDPQGVLLSDALRHMGTIPVKHVAWMLSNCYHLSCFFQFNNIMHGGLTLENVSINPQTHGAQILGGWWFTHQGNEKLKALSSKVLDIAPFELINKKIALPQLDLDCIRFIGRELLGDKNGLHFSKEVPVPLSHWLRGASKDNAFNEYEMWHKVLHDSFGVRRFIKMELTSNDIYI